MTPTLRAAWETLRSALQLAALAVTVFIAAVLVAVVAGALAWLAFSIVFGFLAGAVSELAGIDEDALMNSSVWDSGVLGWTITVIVSTGGVAGALAVKGPRIRVGRYSFQGPLWRALRDRPRTSRLRKALETQAGRTELIAGGRAQLLHDDPEWGRLWSIDAPGEAVVMVECINSTPEPDGTYKNYFLRVPPTTRTVREALAWTFDVPHYAYRLEAQT